MKILVSNMALLFLGFSCLCGQGENNENFRLSYLFDEQCNLIKFVPILNEIYISDSIEYGIILSISKPRDEREENAILISEGFINEYDREFIFGRGHDVFNAEVKGRFLSTTETFTFKDTISIEELKCK